jgi:hypothetical protein
MPLASTTWAWNEVSERDVDSLIQSPLSSDEIKSSLESVFELYSALQRDAAAMGDYASSVIALLHRVQRSTVSSTQQLHECLWLERLRSDADLCLLVARRHAKKSSVVVGGGPLGHVQSRSTVQYSL